MSTQKFTYQPYQHVIKVYFIITSTFGDIHTFKSFQKSSITRQVSLNRTNKIEIFNLFARANTIPRLLVWQKLSKLSKWSKMIKMVKSAKWSKWSKMAKNDQNDQKGEKWSKLSIWSKVEKMSENWKKLNL